MPECNSSLTIRLLGPLEVHWSGQSLPRLRSRKGEWLLALLALRAGREVERDWLKAVLWPESPEAKAQLSLRVSLKDLRRALGPEAVRLASPTLHTLRLDLTGADVDVLAFDGLIRRDDEASLEQAVALYRGPLLEGCVESWVFEERQAREERFLAAREALARQAMARGDAAAAERHLRLLVARDPLRESAQRLLMQALAAGGSYAAALHAYRELRLLLHRELHAEPDPETRAAFETIRTEARRRSRPLPDAHGAASHATVMRGVALAGDRAAPLTGDAAERAAATAHNLPCLLTRFIGRAEEIAEIRRLLATERLVTLTGPGGCGKTRLALEVGLACLGRDGKQAGNAGGRVGPGTDADPATAYEDGVWLVELAALSVSNRVPRAVLGALGLPETADGVPTAVLIQHLRPRKLLLVVDNCEPHVAACAELAEALLRACPGLQVLATSREALGVAGERLLQVPPLSLPPLVDSPGLMVAGRTAASAERPPGQRSAADLDPSALLEYESVRLFVDRATAAHSPFRLGHENAPAVAAVCRGLDGMPLAIELAAARVKLLSVEQIAAGLTDRLGLLTAGSRTAPLRHRTLRASIDWSHDLLSEPEQILLRRLSVFRVGWSLQAALGVCGDFGLDGQGSSSTKDTKAHEGGTAGGASACVGPPSCSLVSFVDPSVTRNLKSKIQNEPVFDLLARLVEKSLVVREERRGEARFRLLETIAEYAREKLDSAGERAGMRERHRDWCLLLAEAGPSRMWGAEVDAWRDRIELEAENLRAALAWSLERGEQRPALRLGAGLASFWGRRYLLSEGREQLERLLTWSQSSPPTPERARLLKEAGIFAKALGQHAEARRRFEESRESYCQLGDEAAAAAVLSDLAELALNREGDAAAGRAHLEEQLSRCQALGDPHATATALGGLSHLAHLAADYRRARELGEAVVRLQGEASPSEALEKGLQVLGYLVYDLGDHAAAMAHFEERVKVLRARAHAQGVDLPPRSAGSRAADRRPGWIIRSLWEEYLPIYERVADRRRLAGTRLSLGSLVFEQGDYAAAQAMWEESLSHFREAGDRANTVLTLNNLAELARSRSEYDAARALLDESRRISEAIHQRRTVADAIYRLGLLASDLGDWQAAQKHLSESRAHYHELGHQWPLLLTLCHQAILARRQGDLKRARGLLGEALPRLRQTERQPGIALALAARGHLLRVEGALAQARGDFLESLALRRPRADRLGIADCLEGLSAVDAGARQHQRAARLLGAAAALREAIGAPLPPADRRGHDRLLASIRAAVGPEGFAAAWAEGGAMPVEEAAICHALNRCVEGQR